MNNKNIDKAKEGSEKTIKTIWYKIPIECTNCGNPNYNQGESWFVEIPMGKSIEDYCKETSCKICGCLTLRGVK